MARFDIEKVRVRRDLEPQREPYWGPRLAPGLYLGVRKLETGECTWIARQRVDGAQRYQSFGYANEVTYDDAASLARKWATATRQGVDTSRVRTVADACREYVEDRRREKGDTSAEATEGHYRRYVYGHAIGKVALLKLTTAQIKKWREGLDMAPATRNRVLAAIKAALNYAVASRYVDAGRVIEWRSVKRQPVTSRRTLYLDREQRHALIDAVPDYAKPLLQVLSLLPVRVGAIAACTVADFQRDVLHIRHDKAGAGRFVPLTPAAVAILRREAKGKLPAAPLIAYMDGSAWNKPAWVQVIKRRAAAIGLPDGTCAYSFRHSVITDMLAGGMDSLTVARVAGTSLDMIERHYGHLLQRHAVDAMAKLAL